MKKIIFLFFYFFVVFSFSSCKRKKTHGDFTLISEKYKKPSLGRLYYVEGHSLEYKGKQIDWSSIIDVRNPNIEEYNFLNLGNNEMIVEVMNNYYLLLPNDEKVDIKFIAVASTNIGLFSSKSYCELLKNDFYFHKAGMRLNLKTFKKDTLLYLPRGRFLATDDDANKIIYVSGVFNNDINLQKTLRKNGHYLKTGEYVFDENTNNSKVEIFEWDLISKKQYSYSYVDTTLWKKLDKFYEDNSYNALSKSFDSAFIFNLFKWDKDSIGVTHLIPKNVSPSTITIEKLDSLGLSASEKNF
jgi:hypothetical protein